MIGLGVVWGVVVDAVGVVAGVVADTPRPSLPQPGRVDLPADLNEKVGELLNLGRWLSYVVGVACFFYAGITIAKNFRDQGGDMHLGPAVKVAIGLVVASSAFSLADWLMF